MNWFPWSESPLKQWGLGTCNYYSEGDFVHIFVVLAREVDGVPIIIQAQGSDSLRVFNALQRQANSPETAALIARLHDLLAQTA